jgi:flagellar basal-body rod protein FlgB
MANPIDNALRFHAEALNLRAFRQELLAANIANADTPGYQARDIDFRRSLQDAIAGREPTVQLARTARGHIAPSAGSAGAAAAGTPLYRTVVQASLDGNTVDMDVERAQFAENAIRYEANLTFINGQLKTLLAAIQG